MWQRQQINLNFVDIHRGFLVLNLVHNNLHYQGTMSVRTAETPVYDRVEIKRLTARAIGTSRLGFLASSYDDTTMSNLYHITCDYDA